MTVIVPGKPIPPIVVEPTVDGPVTVQVGRPGPVGPEGDPGPGVPVGGTTGQVLTKTSGADYATNWQTPSGGAGVTDGDKGDITVSGTGSVWTIDTGAVTDAKIAAVAWGKLTGIPAPISGTTAAFTTAQETKLAGVATGATANAADAFLLARANHTGTQAAGTITGLAAVATSGSASDLGAGTLPNARLAAFGSGDVSFAAGGGAGTIAADAVTNAKLANMAANSLKGNNTGSAADPLDLTVAQVKTLLAYTPADIGAATSAQANATHTGDATGATALTLATVNSNVGSFGTATQVAQFTVNGKGLTTAAANVSISIPATAISDSTAAGRSMVTAATATAQTALLDAFTSGAKGLAPASGGGTTTFLRADGTWAAPAGGGATNLSWTASTRTVASDTGTDAVITLFTSTDPGLTPLSGGGTTNFLRADGTWAAPGGGGATNLTWTASTSTVASDTGTDAVLTAADGTNAGLMTAANFTKLAGIAAGATVFTTEDAQDAVGAMVDASLTYVDGTPLLQRAALTGAVTAAAGSNATSLGSFTKAQLDTAVSDGNVLYVGDVTTNATHTGDVTGATALTIANDAVTNAKAANMATATIKGRATAGTGDPEDLTPAQARGVLALPAITVSTTAPGSPAVGDLWVDTN